jgi:guanylate cyclase
VVGGIAVVLSVVIILAYRNYRYEQELDSLLWKIDSSEIKVRFISSKVFEYRRTSLYA